MRKDIYEISDDPVFDLDVKDEGIDPSLLERVKKELKWEVINHPLTLGPFILGAGSFAYAVVLAPFFGGLLIALPVGAASLLLTAANGGTRLIHVGEKYAKKVSELRIEYAEKREKEESKKINDSIGYVKVELNRMIGPQSSRARLELEQLIDAFGGVSNEMNQYNAGLFMEHLIRRISPSVKDIYKEGLKILACVLELLRKDPSLDRSILQREKEELESSLEELYKDESKNSRMIDVKKRALALRIQRIEKADWRDETVEEFLHQADTCEEVLRTTREDLIKSRLEQSDTQIDEMLNRLKSQISMMRRIQEEFKNSQGLNLPITPRD